MAIHRYDRTYKAHVNKGSDGRWHYVVFETAKLEGTKLVRRERIVHGSFETWIAAYTKATLAVSAFREAHRVSVKHHHVWRNDD